MTDCKTCNGTKIHRPSDRLGAEPDGTYIDLCSNCGGYEGGHLCGDCDGMTGSTVSWESHDHGGSPCVCGAIQHDGEWYIKQAAADAAYGAGMAEEQKHSHAVQDAMLGLMGSERKRVRELEAWLQVLKRNTSSSRPSASPGEIWLRERVHSEVVAMLGEADD